MIVRLVREPPLAVTPDNAAGWDPSCSAAEPRLDAADITINSHMEQFSQLCRSINVDTVLGQAASTSNNHLSVSVSISSFKSTSIVLFYSLNIPRKEFYSNFPSDVLMEVNLTIPLSIFTVDQTY